MILLDTWPCWGVRERVREREKKWFHLVEEGILMAEMEVIKIACPNKGQQQ